METPVEIIYRCSPRCRHISVRISAENIQANYPVWASRAEAEVFVAANWKKIRFKQQRLQNRPTQALILTPEKPLQTLTFCVCIIPETGRTNLQTCLQNNRLQITYPAKMNLRQAQPLFWNSIHYFLRKEAKRILPDRTANLAQQYGFKYADVKIQSSRSRWGSCSRAKHINLSYYLLLVPAHLVDYVILHELCHTVEMNHGERFWTLLNRVTDNQAKKLRQELKTVRMP